MPFANNKGVDQPAHPCSLINAFVVRCLDSIMPLVSIPEISSLYIASMTAGRFEFTLVANPEYRFSREFFLDYLLYFCNEIEPRQYLSLGFLTR